MFSTLERIVLRLKLSEEELSQWLTVPEKYARVSLAETLADPVNLYANCLYAKMGRLTELNEGELGTDKLTTLSPEWRFFATGDSLFTEQWHTARTKIQMLAGYKKSRDYYPNPLPAGASFDLYLRGFFKATYGIGTSESPLPQEMTNTIRYIDVLVNSMRFYNLDHENISDENREAFLKPFHQMLDEEYHQLTSLVQSS